MTQTIVTFKSAWSVYNKGDLAGFRQEQAEKLIKTGVASAYQPKTNKQKATPAKESGASS